MKHTHTHFVAFSPFSFLIPVLPISVLFPSSSLNKHTHTHTHTHTQRNEAQHNTTQHNTQHKNIKPTILKGSLESVILGIAPGCSTFMALEKKKELPWWDVFGGRRKNVSKNKKLLHTHTHTHTLSLSLSLSLSSLSLSHLKLNWKWKGRQWGVCVVFLRVKTCWM